MRLHRFALFVTLCIWALFGRPAEAAVRPEALPQPRAVQSGNGRLVVFEGFLRYG